MQRVVEIRVEASLDLSDHATHRARFAADYDSSWQQWLEEYDRGHAVVARLKTTVRFRTDGGGDEEVEVVNDGVWLELDQHRPKVLEQIREVAYKDTRPLEAELWRRGMPISAVELEQMFLDVRLEDDLEQRVARFSPGASDAGVPRSSSRY